MDLLALLSKIPEEEKIRGGLYQSKRPNDVDCSMKVFILGKRDHISLVTTRVGHQLEMSVSSCGKSKVIYHLYPDAHLGHNAQVALRKQSIIIRTKPIWKQLPAFVSRILVSSA